MSDLSDPILANNRGGSRRQAAVIYQRSSHRLQVPLRTVLIALMLIWGMLSTGCGGGGSSSVTPPISAPPVGSSTYDIQLRFIGEAFTPSQQTVFAAAAEQWGRTITGDIPDLSLILEAGSCLSQSPAVNQVVDDLLIDASVIPIDGEGGILGQAGPCTVRNDTLLPAYGGMEFDQADVARLEEEGQFDRVVLHEMGHVLGIGTTWVDKGLLVGIVSLSPQYVGEEGIAQYEELGGEGSVPVENRGGVGTRADHWRESVFQSELLTGALDVGAPNPLSILTIGSLVDLGYGVDLSQAEPYTLPSEFGLRGPLIELNEGQLSTPIRLVDPAGRVLRLLPR